MDLEALLRALLQAGGDSLQFRVGQPPLMYTGAAPAPFQGTAIAREALLNLIAELLSPAERVAFNAGGWVDTHHVPRDPRLGEFMVRARQTPQGPALGLRAAARPADPLGAAAESASFGSRPGLTAPAARTGPGAPSLNQGPVASAGEPLDDDPFALGPVPARPERARVAGGPPRATGAVPTQIGPAIAITKTANGAPPSTPGPTGAATAPLGEAVAPSISSPGSSVPDPSVPGPSALNPSVPGPSVPGPSFDPQGDPSTWGWPADDLATLLVAAITRRASDVVVSTGSVARVRRRTAFEPVPGAAFDAEAIYAVLGDALTPLRRHEIEVQGSTDVALQLRSPEGRLCRFRVNVFRQLHGLGAAFRPIWDEVPSFAELHLPTDLIALTDLPHGLVLVTGPTGSGKSTTLSALIEHINAHHQRHIITLEDPIEFVFRGRQSLIHQREVGQHVDTFAQGLRAALREAPDVILVGEMRDPDTITAALTAAETGHLVFSTLHSGTAQQTLDRLIDVFPENLQPSVRVQVSEVLRAVVAQRLLPRADQTGRVPALEIVRVTYAVANIIRDRRTHQLTSVLQTQRSEGMRPLDTSLVALWQQGLITRETALRVAQDRRIMEATLGVTNT